MRVDVNGHCTSGAGTIRLQLISGIGLNLHRSSSEKVMTLTLQWLTWCVSLSVQWYRNDYVEALKKDYARVCRKLGDALDTGIGLDE